MQTKRKDDVDYDRAFGESLKKNNSGGTKRKGGVDYDCACGTKEANGIQMD